MGFIWALRSFQEFFGGRRDGLDGQAGPCSLRAEVRALALPYDDNNQKKKEKRRSRILIMTIIIWHKSILVMKVWQVFILRCCDRD